MKALFIITAIVLLANVVVWFIKQWRYTGPKGSIYKSKAMVFFTIAIIFSLGNMILAIMYGISDYPFIYDLGVNVETCLLIVGISGFIYAFVNGSTNKQISGTDTLSKKVNLLSKIWFFVISVAAIAMIVVWIALTVVGNKIDAGHVKSLLAGKLYCLGWISFVIFLVLALAAIALATAKLMLIFNNRKASIMNASNIIVSLIGSLCISMGYFIMFMGMNQIGTGSGQLGIKMLSFLTIEYTNAFSYMIFYFSIGGLWLIVMCDGFEYLYVQKLNNVVEKGTLQLKTWIKTKQGQLSK